MIVDADRVVALAMGWASAETVGPGSDLPWIGVMLERMDPAVASGLGRLPCPVIGIGKAGDAAAEACDAIVSTEAELAAIDRTMRAASFAAMVLVQHLRASATLPVEAALVAESLAYGTVQQGADFVAWRATAPPPAQATGRDVLAIEREGDTLRLCLNDPSRLNAIGVAMRDALAEALDLALADETIRQVKLTAAGRCFSTGGDVAEFGLAPDPATAHWVRTLRLPASRAARLGNRLAVHVDGAAIGAGIELAAFAGRLTATPRSWFQLPELRYGLIPGAGGTVSMARRIGRHRTAYLALTMRRLPAADALAWGLVDALST